MFFHNKSRRSTNSARKQEVSRTAQIERLEDRKMMTSTTIVLDFTPDTHSGSFWDTFRYTRNSQNEAPAFLDFNKDGYISKTDALIASRQVAGRVRALFNNAASGYDVELVNGDVTKDTNLGKRYLEWGLKYKSEQVQVMYIGGRNAGKLGVAPVAANRSNVEGYGCTYSQEVALMLGRLQSRGYSVQSQHFVNTVAATASHELGHMYGLRHSLGQYSNDIMNPSDNGQSAGLRFISNTRQTSDGTYQSAFAELQRSFAGQTTIFSGYGRGGYLLAGDAPGTDEHHDCPDHDHAAETSATPTAANALAAANVGRVDNTLPVKAARHADEVFAMPQVHRDGLRSIESPLTIDLAGPERKLASAAIKSLDRAFEDGLDFSKQQRGTLALLS
jgi:predicted Zn-dependent protease